MDLKTAADELYALSPDDFIERRKQLVAEARQARDGSNHANAQAVVLTATKQRLFAGSPIAPAP